MKGHERQSAWLRGVRVGVRVGAAAYSSLSAFPLVFLLVVGGGRVKERATVLSTTKADGREFDGFGLSYDGLSGTALLWAQLLIVVGAVLVSTRRSAVGVGARGVLFAWAIFVLANTLWVVVAGGYSQMSWLVATATVGGILTGTDLTLGALALRAR